MERTWTVDLLWILLALGLVALNGFFVAAEFALVKVRPARLAQLAREGRPFARTAHWLYRRLDRSLSACQLGITMASLALGWIGEPAVAHLIAPLFDLLGVTSSKVVHGFSFAIAFTAITAAHIVLGEQAPKIFAIRRPELLAIWCAEPLRAFYVVSFPLLHALDAATSGILRLLGVPRAGELESPHSEEELRSLLGAARTHGELSPWEHRLVEAAFDVNDMVCRQIMLPRTDVVYLDVNAPIAESLRIMRSTRHTRYPVCEGSLDRVLGVVHVKDLVGLDHAAGIDLRTMLRPPRYVPETVPINRLLGQFQATRQQMALVVDEHGLVVGIVTMENVIEEIIGPVQDEFDLEETDIVPRGPGHYHLRGGTHLEKLSEVLGIKVDAEGVDTVAGLVALELSRVPVTGDRVELPGALLEVIEVRHNRATLVRLALRGKSTGDEGAATGLPGSEAEEERED